ncbi:MAG: hydroxymethylbilane synthase [Cardiobacteriaceae bacterium]|nr:hydroxymethylbilane synthase [Cardiobacteriaceae bacterium]
MREFSTPKQIKIATRKSKLAIWQSEFVAEQLRKILPDTEISLLELSTRGDEILNQPLAKIGGKGLFIKELETAILDGRADIAVHSMKDVAADLPEEFEIAAILHRHDPRDCLLSKNFSNLKEIPAGGKIGTCSLRRRMQLAELRQDLQILDLRGNINTRIQKMFNGEFDAILLASAGVERLNICEIKEKFAFDDFLPAAGQGAIGIEIAKNSPLLPLIQKLNDANTAICVQAERNIAKILNASCQIPLAAYAEILPDEKMQLRAKIGYPKAEKICFFQGTANIRDWKKLSEEAANALIAQGAREILEKLTN